MLEGLLSPRSPSIAWTIHDRGCACKPPRSRPGLVRTTGCIARVYIAATHLEGMERVESFLKIVGRGVQDVIALHTMTIIEEAVEGETSLNVRSGSFSGLRVSPYSCERLPSSLALLSLSQIETRSTHINAFSML